MECSGVGIKGRTLEIAPPIRIKLVDRQTRKILGIDYIANPHLSAQGTPAQGD
jgi:hypothetical protein